MPTANKQSLHNGSVIAELTTRMWNGHEIQKYKVTDGGSEIGDLLRVTDALSVINKPALIPWAVRMATEYLSGFEGQPITQDLLEEAKKQHTKAKKEAANLGTQVHKWAEEYIKTGERKLPNDERVVNGILAFLKWVEEHTVEFISSERMVYSRMYQYIGTMDAEAEVNGERCVVDFKTSKAVYPEMRYQVAA